MKRYVNEVEISHITGLAIQTIRNMRCQRRGFPYIKLGRSVRYDPDEVVTYMEERKITPELS